MLLLDNGDSFTGNLWVKLSQVSGAEVLWVKNVNEIPEGKRPVVIGPGPGQPQDYADVLQWLKDEAPLRPVLGICLGHQMLGVVHGVDLMSLPEPQHGRRSLVEGLKSFVAMRYHSFVLAHHPQATEYFREDHTVAASFWNDLHQSVQYHPESVGTDPWVMKELLDRWLKRC